jgi:uncharacterized protein (DUF302 family)
LRASIAAAKVGVKPNPTRLIICGTLKSGTPAMIAIPTLALDLPMKALIWEESEGKLWIYYKSAEYLRRQHHIPEEFPKTFVATEALFHSIVH